MDYEKNWVTKSNDLIMCRGDLTIAEARLISTIASLVQPHDEDFKEYEIPVADYLRLLGRTDGRIYQEIDRITDQLIRRVLEFRGPEGFIKTHWFSSFKYRHATGTLICKFDPELKPGLLKLKKNYTTYQLENFLRLRSKYSIKIYEILKSRAKIGKWEIELDELRTLLFIPPSYKWDDIKRQILQPAKKELTTTDIKFDFEPVKRGRRVAGVKFSIHSTGQQSLELGLPDHRPAPEKVDHGLSVTDSENQEINELLDLVPTSHKKRVVRLIRDLVTEYGSDYTREKILLANEANAKEKLKNYAGWLRRAIERDFEVPEQKEKENLPPNKQFFLLPEQEQEKWIKRVAEHPAVVDLPKNTAARRGEQLRQAIKFWWKNR